MKEIKEEFSNDPFVSLEICQTCGLEFGNKAVLKIHNSLVHPEENKDDQNRDLGRKDEADVHDNSEHVRDSVQENYNLNINNDKHDVEIIEKPLTILEETKIQMQPDAEFVAVIEDKNEMMQDPNNDLLPQLENIYQGNF